MACHPWSTLTVQCGLEHPNHIPWPGFVVCLAQATLHFVLGTLRLSKTYGMQAEGSLLQLPQTDERPWNGGESCDATAALRLRCLRVISNNDFKCRSGKAVISRQPRQPINMLISAKRRGHLELLGSRRGSIPAAARI